MKKIFILLFIGAIILASSSCKKISTPNGSKKIFGEWDYQSNSGGFSGSGGSTRFCNECWVDITDKGCFIVYDGSDKKSKKKFTIEMKESIYDVNPKTSLVYKNGSYETFQISGDTLYLSDEVYDGYTYRFVRK
jgi:hypothetical protein